MTLTNSNTTIDEIEGPIYIASPDQRQHRLLLDLPIAWRLMLGFLSAALIAAIVVGIVGVQRITSLSSQSNFYQSLVRTNTTLANDATLLQLMTSKTNEALAEATSLTPSQEDLAITLDGVHGLIDHYDTDITSYTTNDILSKHPEQVALLLVADQAAQVNQQRTLVGSAVRTWQVYHTIQEQVLQFIVSGNVQAAQYMQRFQAEPANSDALSAINALIQFNEHSIATVEDVENVEAQQTLIITIVGATLAFLIIILIGIFISRSLVARLHQLLRGIQAVEHGDASVRATDVGRDEIGRVLAFTNTMLETIADMQEKTRHQHNALMNAAHHLFEDIEVVSINDLRAEVTMSEDPIKVLASALNFSIGRLDRLTKRTQSLTEQLYTISHRQLEHATSLTQALTEQKQEQVTSIRHMSTQFAREIIYLGEQLDSIAQDLEQYYPSQQDEAVRMQDREEEPHGPFSGPFDNLSRKIDIPDFPSVPGFVSGAPDVRTE